MPNPWLKKNPFMSMWLSTANRMAGSLRAQTTAQVKRQVTSAVTEATRKTPGGSGVAKPVAAKAKRKR